LTADARLDEGMLYADDPFEDLGLDDESSDEGSAAICIAANCDSATVDTRRQPEPEASAAETLVQQDTTGATFCWPAALALCNFLLENNEFIRGKKVRRSCLLEVRRLGSGFKPIGDLDVIDG
jgi:hypothetical protein